MTEAMRNMFLAIFVAFGIQVWKGADGKPSNFNFFDKVQAEFAESLDDYDITFPTLTNENGNFVSYGLHEDHVNRVRRSLLDTETEQYLNSTTKNQNLFYKLSAFGRDMHLNLALNTKLVSPAFVVERASGKIEHYVPTCHYQGKIRNQQNSVVAISNCKGLEGLLHTEFGENYIIEPVRGHNHSETQGNPHLVYKQSYVRKARSLHEEGAEACGVSENRASTRQKRDTGRPMEPERALRRKSRKRRSISMEQFVETFVVVDEKMTKFYKGQNLEQYVLTVMNMVAALYHDASIGAAVNVVVVRLMILDKELEELEITHHADNTLASFCEYAARVNPPDEYHPQHHDVAVLLTRVDICHGMNRPCGTLGLAQVNGMCSKSKSCNINEDTGLSVAYTVTHELGHNFGMEHDGVGNKCHYPRGDDRYIMSPRQSLFKHPYMWSSCSKKYIQKFLFKGFGWCLDDEPTQHNYEFKTILPGVIYDFDHQCKMRHGSMSEVCHVQWIQDVDPCSRLWCSYEYQSTTTCVMRSKPAADGTHCKSGHWCYRGSCVKKQPLPNAVDGNWGQWESWSSCSRTCGGGIRFRKRHCDNPRPKNGGKYCLGKFKKYEICNSKACQRGSVGFRNTQCHRFSVYYFPNDLEPMSRMESVYDPSRPCELHCRHKGSFHAIKVSEEVIDGTPCREGRNDVCVSGKCEPVGCDWVLHSNSKEDKCGICHGDGSSCETKKFNFNKTILSQGEYVETAFIPAGARNIRVEEVRGARNYLALKSSNGKFYLNGHWRIQGTGKYDAGGTKVFYSRNKQKDFLKAVGPTKEDMHVLLFVQGPNPGIDIEYTISKQNGTTKQKSYLWRYKKWSKCSAECGVGTKIAHPECVEGETKTPVDDKYCHGQQKPSDLERACNLKSCPPEWWTGSWQECSKVCGYGFRRRSVLCIRRLKEDEQMALKEDKCNLEKRPAEKKLCYKGPCTARWIVSEWSSCTTNCGLGIQRRSIQCSSKNVRMCSFIPKPNDIRLCNGTKCPHWVPGEWGQCDAKCGLGYRYRTVSCTDAASMAKVHPDRCRNERKPNKKDACFIRQCLQWSMSPWSKCSRSCGNGTQMRVASCPGDPTLCRDDQKPVTQRPCSVGPCAVWKTGPWGQCSSSCLKWRTVVCKRVGTYQDDNTCSIQTRPKVTRSCRGGRCRGSKTKTKRRKCRKDYLSINFCKVVKLAGFCSSPKYYSRCCKTCSRR